MKIIITSVIALTLFASCTETNKDRNVTGDEDTAVLQREDNIPEAKENYVNWQEVDWTSPIVQYDEVKSKEVQVRTKDNSSIFTVDENILFDFDKSVLRDNGKQKLDEIATAIKNRYPEGMLGIYGYTDNIGSKEYNKELSEARAESVKQYMNQQTSIDMSRINTYARGESNPVADNSTEAGRQKNRRVDIVARNTN